MKGTYRFQTEKPKQESKTTTKKSVKRSRISPPRRKIYSFKDIRIQEDCGSIDLTKKSIETFIGLPSLKYLTRLNLDSNPLKSFEGAPTLPNLRWLSAKNSPISRSPYFKLMAIIVFGKNITTINNEKVTEKIYKLADDFRESLYPKLLKGLLIANIAPLRFIDTKNEEIVNPEPSLLSATRKIGYKAPSVQEFERTIVERSREQFRIPSIASICDEIIQREVEPNTNYFPQEFLDTFLSQVHDLRVKYDAKYENSSSDDNYDIDEELNNESTQSHGSINGASPIKPPQSKLINQANHVAKRLIQSESDSELKISQSNIEENEKDEDNNHSQLSNSKDEMKRSKVSDYSIQQEGSENDTHSRKEIKEEEEEEDFNEDHKSIPDNAEEEEEEEKASSQKNGSINIQEDEEETKNENEASGEHKSSDDDDEKASKKEEGEEEENENEKENSKEENENIPEEDNNSKSEEDNQSIENNEEEENKTENDADNNNEEEDSNVDTNINKSNEEEEEEKNENSKSAEGLEQDQGETNADNEEEGQNENLSEDGDQDE